MFKGESGRYVTFLTLGIGNGQYIDVTVKKPVAYADYDYVTGTGRLRMSNDSYYIESHEVTAHRL